jgi:hypothetical protein
MSLCRWIIKQDCTGSATQERYVACMFNGLRSEVGFNNMVHSIELHVCCGRDPMLVINSINHHEHRNQFSE